MTSRELAEWMAYERLEPFGETRADVRAALICWAFNGTMGGKARMDDFILHFGKEYEKRPPRELDKDLAKVKTAAESALPSVGRGLIKFYKGDAPAIVRHGKKMKQTPWTRRLQEILRG